MHRRFGRSAYLFTFQEHYDSFITNEGSEYDVFTSFHIGEEIEALGSSYSKKALEFIDWFHHANYRIIADISPRTYKALGVSNFDELIKQYPVDVVRPDFGFTLDELKYMATKIPLMLNASMQDTNLWTALKHAPSISALHNFYPRPETGLDEALFRSLNQHLTDLNIPVHAFVKGSEPYRGPLHCGLPTLERHRHASTYASAVDLWWNFGVQSVIVGDMGLDPLDQQWIDQVLRTNTIVIPIHLDAMYAHLHQTSFSIRIDSPRWTMRFLESRTYGTPGARIEPLTAKPRPAGCLTIDNLLYDRYSGEIQLIREALPADERVNVIGQLDESHELLLQCIQNGSTITLFNTNQ